MVQLCKAAAGGADQRGLLRAALTEAVAGLEALTAAKGEAALTAADSAAIERRLVALLAHCDRISEQLRELPPPAIVACRQCGEEVGGAFCQCCGARV